MIFAAFDERASPIKEWPIQIDQPYSLVAENDPTLSYAHDPANKSHWFPRRPGGMGRKNRKNQCWTLPLCSSGSRAKRPEWKNYYQFGEFLFLAFFDSLESIPKPSTCWFKIPPCWEMLHRFQTWPIPPPHNRDASLLLSYHSLLLPKGSQMWRNHSSPWVNTPLSEHPSADCRKHPDKNIPALRDVKELDSPLFRFSIDYIPNKTDYIRVTFSNEIPLKILDRELSKIEYINEIPLKI